MSLGHVYVYQSPLLGYRKGLMLHFCIGAGVKCQIGSILLRGVQIILVSLKKISFIISARRRMGMSPTRITNYLGKVAESR